jgi:drug/metabolite transporter (DMT)-like permease
MLKDIPPMVVTTYTTVGCGIFLFAYSLINGKMMLITAPNIMGVIATLSIFSTIISILTFAMGLRILGATKASIISAIEPVITVVLAFILFGETLNWIQMIGATLIVLSILVIEMKFGKKAIPFTKTTDISEVTVANVDTAE